MVTTGCKQVMSLQGNSTVGPSSAQWGAVPIKHRGTIPGVVPNPSGCRVRKLPHTRELQQRATAKKMWWWYWKDWAGVKEGLHPCPCLALQEQCNSPRDEQPRGWDAKACHELTYMNRLSSSLAATCPAPGSSPRHLWWLCTMLSSQQVSAARSPALHPTSRSACPALLFQNSLLRPAAASHCCVHRDGHGNVHKNLMKNC